MTCSALSIALISNIPSNVSDRNSASAKTIDEIQAEKKANDEKIADLEKKIGNLEGNKNKEKEFQNVLNEQISVIQANITLLNTELEQINDDIILAQDNVALLDISISKQEEAITQKVELFKERLCTLYVSGNDTLATVLVGSSSFYDMLTRVEMVNRIAAADEVLINNLLAEIKEMEKTQEDLEAEKETLKSRLADQEVRKEEKASEMTVLYDKMAQTQSEIDRISGEQTMLEVNKEELAKANKELAAEEEEIREAVRKAAEEAQRRYEEEQRRLAEEAARKAAEEAAAKKAAEEAARKAAEEAAAKKAAEEAAAAQRAAIEAAAAAQSYEEEIVYTTTQAPVYTQAPTTTTQAVTTTTYVAPAPSSNGFMWPAPGFRYISSPYGMRWGSMHKGIDVGDAGIGGGTAVASRSGVVVRVVSGCTHDYAKNSSCGCGGGYGNYILISHDGTYSTLYGHLRSTLVSEGQYVQQGEAIGIIGCTGFSTGDHLHFEVQVNGVQQDPQGYVNP